MTLILNLHSSLGNSNYLTLLNGASSTYNVCVCETAKLSKF